MSVDLTTNYLGLKLKNPLVIAACPLTEQLETLQRLEAAGRGRRRPPLALRGADRARRRWR